MSYQHLNLSEKWSKIWDELGIYRTPEQVDREKEYILVEFPYPSGSGLHLGHAFSFIGADVYARFQRMHGKNVLFPMGWDAFGLPTENYAIKVKRNPQDITKENTICFKRQMKTLELSFDWSREINTTNPDYYKWTQWIFVQLFKKGLVYKKEVPINWCPKCMIGLANEEVVDGKCERCGTVVFQKNVSQWIIKITDYADRLIEGLKRTDFIKKVKAAQINWIGKSNGARVMFKIEIGGKSENLDIFTTRPDTLWGATFMVLAPEHALIKKLLDSDSIDTKRKKEIRKYLVKSKHKSDLERTDLAKKKTGVF
ncbi:class I tRNA ligase family protein, partial [bacterium]|nr:class I tRNA ligase family protein [bacterium]